MDRWRHDNALFVGLFIYLAKYATARAIKHLHQENMYSIVGDYKDLVKQYKSMYLKLLTSLLTFCIVRLEINI